jgi:protein-tyrosine-phosphatase
MGSLNIVTLCTGNVARSVMLGYMLTTLAEASGVERRVADSNRRDPRERGFGDERAHPRSAARH